MSWRTFFHLTTTSALTAATPTISSAVTATAMEETLKNAMTMTPTMVSLKVRFFFDMNARAKEGLCREPLIKGRAEHSWSPCANKFKSVHFHTDYFIYLCYKTSYLNEEVNCTEPYPSVGVPWTMSANLIDRLLYKWWAYCIGDRYSIHKTN